MPDPNDNDRTVEATQGNAGSPQRSQSSLSFGITAETADPTAEELDARQAAISETRRSGPPLPEVSGPESVAFSVSEGREDTAETQVAEPRKQDR